MIIYNIEINRDLRDKDAVCLGPDAAAQRSMPYISAEDLNDHHPVMAEPGGFKVTYHDRNPVDSRITADAV